MAASWQLFHGIAFIGGLLAGFADAGATGSSLLATRVMLQKKAVFSDLATESFEPTRNLEETAAALDELAASVVNGTEHVTETVRALLKSIRDDLNKIMEETFGEHAEDQSEVDRVQAYVSACAADHDLAWHEAWASSSSRAEETHAQCRSDESSLLAVKQEKCGEYFEASSKQPPGPDCMCPDKNEFTEAEFDTRLQCLKSMKSWVVALYGDLKEKKAACEKATGEHDDAVARCKDRQSTFESEFCTYRGSLTKSCSGYAECRSKWLKEQAAIHRLVQTNEEGRKAEFETADHVRCLLDVFETPPDKQREKFENCSVTVIDPKAIGKLDITYHTAPSEEPCDVSPVELFPCDAQWITRHYSSQPWYPGAPTTGCIQFSGCEAPTTPEPTPAPTPALVTTKGCSQTGTTGFVINGKTVNLHCSVDSDGSWALVHVSLSNANNADNLYPAEGENYAGLAADKDEWASLSEADMHDLWFSGGSPVMKLHTPVGNGAYVGPLPDYHYIQRTRGDDFSPFRAIRYVPEWGSSGADYKICSNSASCYDKSTRTVTHSGRAMHHWENRFLDLANGTRITTSRHGVPGDVTSGCQWLYIFPGTHGCSNGQNAAYCNGQCHSSCRNCLVVSRIYLAAGDLVTVRNR